MITGTLRFEGPLPDGKDRHVVLYVEDTSRADGDAVRIATHKIPVPDAFTGSNVGLPFSADLSGVTSTHTLRAHFPGHDGDDIRVGDMVSTVAVPAEDKKHVEIALKSVG